ncbi:hypothetical protein C8Q79DRAFT_925042 [Trametes meyenii]|nr:hypothetical protein C8Q79DRAFT_925042 [Trametes meyenii]
MRLVWGRKLTWAKGIFLLNRYLTIIYFLLGWVQTVFPMGDQQLTNVWAVCGMIMPMVSLGMGPLIVDIHTATGNKLHSAVGPPTPYNRNVRSGPSIIPARIIEACAALTIISTLLNNFAAILTLVPLSVGGLETDS